MPGSTPLPAPLKYDNGLDIPPNLPSFIPLNIPLKGRMRARGLKVRLCRLAANPSGRRVDRQLSRGHGTRWPLDARTGGMWAMCGSVETGMGRLEKARARRRRWQEAPDRQDKAAKPVEGIRV